MHWQLQDAKNKLSQLVKKAQQHPQVITLHGKEAAVVLSMRSYRQLKETGQSLVEFFQKSPLAKTSLVLERDTDSGRDIQL